MMDAIVQLVRNALCCIKDLQFFRATGMHDPIIGLSSILPQPLNKTTPIEVLIGITQFYAFVSISKSGFALVQHSRTKLATVQSLLGKLQQKKTQHMRAVTDGSNTSSNHDLVIPAHDLLLEKLIKEERTLQRNIFVGINVTCIGIAFFWLFANSFHVTETSWIGGVAALIHALTVMEIALVPLLYYMIVDAMALVGTATVMTYVARVLRRCGSDQKVPLAMLLTEETYSWLLEEGWTPFFSGGVPTFVWDDATEDAGITKEMESLHAMLETWTADKDKRNIKALIQSTADRLEASAVTKRYEGYREFLYFLLNFVAFYGYMLGILVYYQQKENEQSIYVRSLKLGMSNADADWAGNFAGDLMWTIGKIRSLGCESVLFCCC